MRITIHIVLAIALCNIPGVGQRAKGPDTAREKDMFATNEYVASLHRDIRKHLPIGSSRADVSKFLDLRKIMHSHIGDESAAPDNSHTEMAMIRNVSQKAGVNGDLQILLKFDATDSKLVSYSVREIFAGP